MSKSLLIFLAGFALIITPLSVMRLIEATHEKPDTGQIVEDVIQELQNKGLVIKIE